MQSEPVFPTMRDYSSAPSDVQTYLGPFKQTLTCDAGAGAERFMATKLAAIYDQPDNVESYFRHHREIHTPLVKEMPGLQGLVLNRVISDAQGNAAPYVAISEVSFRDGAALQAAMQSPATAKVVRDLMAFANGKAIALVAESDKT
jgi:uncharacterized protein (TIGR02118 family)